MKTFAFTPTDLNPPVVRPRLRLVVLLTAVATFAGCASFSPDGGFSTVEQAAKDRLGKEVRWARTPADQDGIDQRVGELLAKPLSPDDAVQISLLNNRGLQASFQELGITEAEVVEAGRLPNPGFSFSRLRRGDEIELERGIHFKLARLIAMPMIGRVSCSRCWIRLIARGRSCYVIWRGWESWALC
jgi:hypothetical protein